MRGAKRYPFRDAAWEYRKRGWWGTIPVTRRGTKAPLARGVTGHDGVDPNYDRLESLISEFPTANIGIRLPWNVIGIDVDAYDDKHGDKTISNLEAILGPLPVTWRSTSRDDKVSGIYLFQAPRDDKMAWVTDLGIGSGVEIAQRHHRFATVWPSIHNSTGRKYKWWYGEYLVDIPHPEDLSRLPLSWAQYLMSDREYRATSRANPENVTKWYKRVAGGAMCTYMRQSAEREAAKIREAIEYGGTHGALLAVTTHICRNAADGHKGLDLALSIVQDAFIEARVTRYRQFPGERRNYNAEWVGAVNSAMALAADMPQERTDVCSVAADWRRTS